MSQESFATEQSRATAAIAGIQKYFSAMSALLLAGVSYTPTQLVNILQAYVSAITALKEFTTLRAAGRPVAIERHPEKGWRVRDLSRGEDYAGRSGT